MAKPKLQEQAPEVKQFRANWRIEGVTSAPIKPGDVVELKPEVAASLGGAVTAVEDEPAQDNSEE